jgi:muconolactone delta-isomerase
MDPVGLRLQNLAARDQVLALGRLAGTRSPRGLFSVADVDQLFDHIGLPPPPRTRDTISSCCTASW